MYWRCSMKFLSSKELRARTKFQSASRKYVQLVKRSFCFSLSPAACWGILSSWTTGQTVHREKHGEGPGGEPVTLCRRPMRERAERLFFFRVCFLLNWPARAVAVRRWPGRTTCRGPGVGDEPRGRAPPADLPPTWVGPPSCQRTCGEKRVVVAPLVKSEILQVVLLAVLLNVWGVFCSF